MLHDDQFMERTPDLVAKIRKLREAAEKEMNKFTRVADYDVRRVAGQKLKTSSVSGETGTPPQAKGCVELPAPVPAAIRSSIKLLPAPAPAERRNDPETSQ